MARQDLLTDALVQMFLTLIIVLVLVLTGSLVVAVYLALSLIVLIGGFMIGYDKVLTADDERDFHLARWGTMFVVALTGLAFFVATGLSGNVLVGSGMVLYSFIAAADHTYAVGWEDGMATQLKDGIESSEDK